MDLSLSNYFILILCRTLCKYKQSEQFVLQNPLFVAYKMISLFLHFLAVYVLTKLIYVLFIKPLYSPYRSYPRPKRTSNLFGNLIQFYEKDPGVVPLQWSKQFGGVVPYFGLFGEEKLCITDPFALKHILSTNCYDFIKPSEVRDRIGRTLGEGLVFSEGSTHKRQRRLLNPFWTTQNALKSLPTFSAAAYTLRDQLLEKVDRGVSDEGENPEVYGNQGEEEGWIVIDCLKWSSRAALQIIGKAGFDYDFQAFTSKYNDLALAFASVATSAGSKLTPTLLLARTIIHFILAHVPYATGLPLKKIKDVKIALEVIERDCRKIYEDRFMGVKSGLGGGDRDFISMLIRANLAEGEKGMTSSEIAGQLSTMVLAGHETSSTAISWILLALARNPKCQEKLRDELTKARMDAGREGRDELTAKELGELKYLDAVVKEGLRMEPPIAQMNRLSLTSSVVPLKYPILLSDGSMTSSFPIREGTELYLSVRGYNFDKEIFGEDSESFVPERWTEERVKGGNGGYGQLMSFSDGPRVCLGWRFAVLEIKALLSVLVEEFVWSERDVGGTPIERGSAIVMRPFVTGELYRGNRLPLRVAAAKPTSF